MIVILGISQISFAADEFGPRFTGKAPAALGPSSISTEQPRIAQDQQEPSLQDIEPASGEVQSSIETIDNIDNKAEPESIEMPKADE